MSQDRSRLLAPLIGLLASLPLLDCGSSPSDCAADENCAPSSADGGDADASNVGDAQPDIVVPPGCDLAKDVKDSPACVVDEVGVFVSASGSDAAAGTKAAPVQTITKGVDLATSRGLPRVYVCAGLYADAIVLKGAVSIYGGFNCVDFAYNAAKPRVQPADGTKYALDLGASNVTIADVELVGPEQGAPNSIAVRAVDSQGVTFVRAKLEGRAGANGAAGTRTDFTPLPSQTDLNGIDATAGGPGGERSVTCPGGQTTTGGKGGGNGFDGDPGLPSLGGGAGGTVSQCQMSNTGGQPGGAGTTPAAAEGATTIGALADHEWAPRSGSAGTNGSAGQGGGGGAGLGGGSGGGGGAGGCGGAAGGFGAGGGASVALLSVNSAITLRASELSSQKAGDGGAGMAGQEGQQIFGAGGNKNGLGCSGGNGGKGGNGGAGGGGAGGVSAGVLSKGTKPALEDTSIKKGTPGAKGQGGTAGTNDGVDGLAQDFIEVP